MPFSFSLVWVFTTSCANLKDQSQGCGGSQLISRLWRNLPRNARNVYHCSTVSACISYLSAIYLWGHATELPLLGHLNVENWNPLDPLPSVPTRRLILICSSQILVAPARCLQLRWLGDLMLPFGAQHAGELVAEAHRLTGCLGAKWPHL